MHLIPIQIPCYVVEADNKKQKKEKKSKRNHSEQRQMANKMEVRLFKNTAVSTIFMSLRLLCA